MRSLQLYATTAAGARRHRVQERRAVRVDDTLRVPGRAARVTHRRGGAFVDLGVLEPGRVAVGEQLFVAQHPRLGRGVGEGRRVAVADDDVALDGLEVGGDARASSGTRSSSTMITRSAACSTMYVSCSGKSRRLSVWSTAPMHGMAKYASMCSWVFHMKVPTRSPGSIPSPVERDREPIGPGGDLGERRCDGCPHPRR